MKKIADHHSCRKTDEFEEKAVLDCRIPRNFYVKLEIFSTVVRNDEIKMEFSCFNGK